MQDLIAANLKKRVEVAALTSAVDTHNDGAGTSAEAEVTGAVPAPYPDYWQSITETCTARGRRDIKDVNAKKIVETWTGKTRSLFLPDSDFQCEPSLIDLFIEYNTPVPSSTGVERLFSQGILRPKRS
jgi:hypothetical protein